MTEKQPVKVGRFYGVRLLSLVLKVLTIITVLVTVGALGYAAIEYAGLPVQIRTANYRQTGLWQLYNYMIGLVVTGGLTSLVLYGVSQILDVLLSISDSIRALARGDELQLSSDKGLHSSNLKLAHELEELKTIIGQQNRLLRLQSDAFRDTEAKTEVQSPKKVISADE